MAPDVHLEDAWDLYAKAMDEILSEMGVNGQDWTREDLHDLARTGFAELQKIYDEFILWVVYGNDKRAKTMAIMRAMRGKGKGIWPT